MHQSGIIAAAGLFSLSDYEQRLKEDHENAKLFAGMMADLGVDITKPVETNMVWLDFSRFQLTDTDIADYVAAANSSLVLSKYGSSEVRFVFHHQITREAVLSMGQLIAQVIQKRT
jgi:threonine aldolase